MLPFILLSNTHIKISKKIYLCDRSCEISGDGTGYDHHRSDSIDKKMMTKSMKLSRFCYSMDELERLTSLKSHNEIFDEINKLSKEVYSEEEDEVKSSSSEEDESSEEEDYVEKRRRTSNDLTTFKTCELRLEQGDDALILPVPRHVDFVLGNV